MAAFSSILLGLGTVAQVAGTLASIKGQQKAQKAQEKQQALATRRSRRQAIRQAQLIRAQSIASAQGSGTLQSSGAAGGIGSLSSQLGESLGFSTQMSGLSGDISSGLRQASFGQSLAGIGGAAMNFGFSRGATFGDLFGGFSGFGSSGLAPTSSIRPRARST